MRKLFVVLVAIFLMASSAYAWVETSNNGPQCVTTCYMVGTNPPVSGSVVVLQTTSPTYPGKEVTGSTTVGERIYGVVVDGNSYTGVDMIAGKWIKVQTSGYVPIIRTDTATGGASVVTAGDGLSTSGIALKAAGCGVPGANVTQNAVAFSAATADQASATVSGFIGLGI